MEDGCVLRKSVDGIYGGAVIAESNGVTLVRRIAMSILIGFGIVVLLFLTAVLVIWVTNYDPTVAYYAQLPLRLPNLLDRLLLPGWLSLRLMPNRYAATLFVYGLNIIIYAVPAYALVSLVQQRSWQKPGSTLPPPPPEFQ